MISRNNDNFLHVSTVLIYQVNNNFLSLVNVSKT